MKIQAKVEIKGIKPILFHAFNPEALSDRSAKSGSTGNNDSEWKATVTMNDKRNLYINNDNIFATLKEGAKHLKVGKGNLSKKIASTLIVSPSKIYFEDLIVPPEKELLRLDTEKVYLDVRSVVNPMTKGRNLRYRIAAAPGWTCTFFIEWDDYVASKENIKICAENAGMFSGLGDGRAIGLGRFEVQSFQVLTKP